MSERQRIYRTHAVVLRRRDYGDADRILTVVTPALGKLTLIAKGVRKTSSRKAGHLELLTHTSLIIAKARTWDIVTEASTVESFRNVREDLDSISRASFLCELVDNFVESEDENQPLWELLLLALRELDSGQCDPQGLLCWFELHLLGVSGFQPQLFHCLNCGEEIEPVVNAFSLSEGGIFCPRCAEGRSDTEPIEADVLKVLRYLQSHDWPDVRRIAIRPHIVRRVDNLLYRYLLTILERQLRSVDFMRRLQNMAIATPPSIAQGA